MAGKKSLARLRKSFLNTGYLVVGKITQFYRGGALRLEEERLAPLQTNTEEQNSSKQKISEAKSVRRYASSAPAPINPVGVSYRPPRPKATQMPLDWPADYPNDLIPQTEKVVAEAVKKFPEQTQITELCECVVSNLTPDFCAAVQGKTLRADLASYRMDNLLDCLLRYNCDDLEKRYRLKKKVVNSDEWKKLVDEIARVHSAAQPSPATVANGGDKKDQPAEATELLGESIGEKEQEKGRRLGRPHGPTRKVQARQEAFNKIYREYMAANNGKEPDNLAICDGWDSEGILPEDGYSKTWRKSYFSTKVDSIHSTIRLHRKDYKERTERKHHD